MGAHQHPSSVRLAFLDVLRGLAAPAVVIGHYIVLFLTAPQIVAKFTMAEPIAVVALPAPLTQFYALFNLAGVGVGVFFLISGFVIPLSLEGASVRGFFTKRLLRIFPTYWAALAIGVASILLSAAFWSKPVTYSALDYVANAFLIADFFGKLDIPSVMWTLEIELKFYLLAPLFYVTLRRGSLNGVFAWSFGVILFYCLIVSGCVGSDPAECWARVSLIARFSWQAAFITYMLIGSVLFAHFRGLISPWRAASAVVILFLCFAIAARLSSAPGLWAQYGPAFFWALLIFLPCYFFRDRITLARPFAFLADISYPLYIVHPLLGYVVMRLLMAAGAPYLAALPAAVALVVFAACILHRYVETPSIALARRLAAHFEEDVAREGPRDVPASM